MDRERLKYWLALSRLKGVKLNDIKTALSTVKDASELFNEGSSPAADAALKATREKVLAFKDWKWVEAELDKAEKLGVAIITVKDKSYPSLLKETHNPPPILYAKGRLLDEPFAAVAVIGTRTASHYGTSMAETISRGLAGAGVAVISGMARGCDTYAHKGALSVNGYTVAVLGTGVDTPYPKENKKLYEQIAENGLVVSEFPLSTSPLAQNFPARNRIISGMSLGVVVVEAPLKSGAMITAKMAIDENREVFALPGQALGKNSGSHKLIKEGAALAENAEDILSVLFPGKTFPVAKSIAQDKNKTVPKGKAKQVLDILEDDGLHIDVIARKTSLNVNETSALLLEMELNGLITQMPGKIFLRKI